MTTTAGVKRLADLVRGNVVRVPADDPDAASVHYFGVKLIERCELTREQLADAIREAETGYYGDMTPERWKVGPSYIELGGWIGDQGVALALMGLGKLLGLWGVFTPVTIGMTGENAEKFAGAGYVLVVPSNKEVFW